MSSLPGRAVRQSPMCTTRGSGAVASSRMPTSSASLAMQMVVVPLTRRVEWNELRCRADASAPPRTLTFTAGSRGHRRHELLHTGALAFRAGDLAAVVFVD